MATNDLTPDFVEDIPGITRQGGARGSKYDDLLDTVRDEGRVGVLTLDNGNQQTSRYQSIKKVADRREEEDGEVFTVAMRTVGDSHNVYVKYEGTVDEQDEEETPKPAPKKSTAKKATSRKTKKSSKKTATKKKAAATASDF